MVDKHLDKIEAQIKDSLKTEEVPGEELNRLLNMQLLQKETSMNAEKKRNKRFLWYLPMLLNTLVFGVLGVMFSLLVQNNLAEKILLSICIYLIIAGITLTAAGIRYGNFKKVFTVEL